MRSDDNLNSLARHVLIGDMVEQNEQRRLAAILAADSRKLVWLWMWRRHIGPGVDPVALDAAEFGFSLE